MSIKNTSYQLTEPVRHLPETGFLKLSQILGNPKAVPPVPPIIPVCKATWYAGQKTGRYPSPVRIGDGRGSFYKVEAIRALIASV
ncbi:helix-turn-helix transcriptional regulator [Massilia genomosp. 1]|uniref:Transcriptional regulator n=1 Tax=Massilia genomosp. 1 TaxID=2609280 RepID=A0ABX0MPX9_9BURK|nr:transcriptional regulator [Massilia genomosp. 1]NHZ62635.1 transcriptional regulator [Massilia genomosp. 1]